MAESILNISEKLGNLLPQAGRSLRQLKNDVEFIKDKLEDFGSDLKKFAVMTTDNEEDFDKRVRKLTQLAFEAEDVLEVFVNNATPYQGCNILPLITGIFCQCITLQKLKNEIDELKSKLSELQTDSSLIKDPSGSKDAGEACFDRLRKVENEMAPSTNDEDDEMVGFKDVANNLLSLLTTEEPLGELHVVSILADAGTGKTELAWNIYKRCYVGQQFDCVAWFSVSPNCCVENVWKSIMEQVKKQTEEENNEHGSSIASAVGATLQGKDYLIILDDLWKTIDWERISKAFPKSPKKKCRVLITTRIDEIARSANPSREPFKLRPLNEKESFDLFLKKIFKRSTENIPPAILTEEMKKLAWELVSKCGSLPIAIVLLGGLLSGREKNAYEWNDMLEKFHSHLRESRVFRMIFSLSYNDLEYTQKSCFLYLALFPEDSVIDCDKLVRLWVAEGFFEQEEDDAEDLGRKCVKSLIGRSMIGVFEMNLNGTPRTCRIHDLVKFTVEEEAKKTKFSSTLKQLAESVEAGSRRIAIHPNQGIHEGKSSSALPSHSSSTYSYFVPSDIEANDTLNLFNEEENQVASLLMKEEPLGKLEVVSLVGMIGIGKTTLASKIYRRFDIKSHFACRVWVTVPQDFSIIDILKNILQQVKGRLTDVKFKLDDDEYELREMLHRHLKKESNYLIIVDDMLRVEHWDILEGILPTQTQQKCRVLLTTHNQGIAAHATTLNGDSTCLLRHLNDDESLQLFLKTLSKCSEDEIPKEGVLPEEVMNLALEYVQYYVGHPFLIVLVGGLFSVRRKDVSALRDLLARIKGGELWNSILELFVVDLPDHMRYCLTLCLLFPEGTEIHCDALTRIWIAKGFLKPTSDNEIMEDVARNCLKELIQRNWIQVTKRRSTGDPETCHIHDIIRVHCSRYADRVDLPFSLENTSLELVEDHHRSAEKDRQAAAHEAPHFKPPKTFHLVKALFPVLDLFNFPNHLHSLLCFSKAPQVHFKAFPLLRVLDLQGVEYIYQLPNEIGNLTLLRYLGLRGTRVSQIPPWIANLLNLQTLDAPRAEVPLDILKLSQLRHLFARSFYAPQTTCFPNPSSSSSSSSKYLHFRLLKQLQTLEVDIEDWKIRDLHECIKLRVLKLRFRGTADTLLDAIKGLTRLMFLNLTQAGESPSSRPLMQLPSLSDHRQLVDIVVEGTVVTEAKEFPRLVTYLWLEVSIRKQVDPFSRFHELSYLKKLCLRLFKGELSSDAVRMTCSNGRFPKLEFLYIRVDFELENWTVEEGALPNLKVLHIEGEGRLGKLPDGLKHVKTLKELVIPRGWDVPQSLNDGREVTNKVTIKYLNESSMRP